MCPVPRLAANLTTLFTEYPLAERFDRAAEAGFAGVELLFPYGESAAMLQDGLTRNALDLVLFDFPPGDWDAGDRGLAAHPGRREEFGNSVRDAVSYALELKPQRLNCLAGIGTDDAASDAVLVSNLQFAAEAMRALGVQLVVEPLNDRDVPDYAVPTTRAGIELIAAVEHDNLRLQYDLYHSLMMQENPYQLIPQYADQIGHIQIADLPGRHQPGTGAVDFERLFEVIDASGYTGWVSLEYAPEGPTEESFSLLRDLGLLDS